MAKPASLSGFPEWLPSGRLLEQLVLDSLRRTFELHGFSSLETRAVEPLADLLRKGETSKEVYVLSRLQGQDGEDSSRKLGLHFDLTVPLARYVLENAGHLAFPYRRYQIQKVWRGERPQDGRFREFTQADIDVVGMDKLSFHHEVEVALVIADALSALPIGDFRISVNNRKICQGFYQAIGLENIDEALRVIDKLDKIGPQKVTQALIEQAGANEEQAQLALQLAAISGSESHDVRRRVNELGHTSELLEEGLAELCALLDGAKESAPGRVTAELKIARGLDYYTGSVYETTLVGHENLGSICSGGRYDSLASDGKKTYPGVGLSIGVSRLVSRLIATGAAAPSRAVPTAVLVAVNNEGERASSDAVARELRARGIPTEVAPSAAKFGKQIRYADRRQIPYVWFPGEDGGQIKDIRSGQQDAADPATWMPPAEDLWPHLS